MGEAKEIVGSARREYTPEGKPGLSLAVIPRLTGIIDDLDLAITVKQNDLAAEGHSAVPENHYKLGILKGADSLVRRARAMLEDYGIDLDQAINPTEDDKAAKGEEIEAHGDMAHFEGKGLCSSCGNKLDDAGACLTCGTDVDEDAEIEKAQFANDGKCEDCGKDTKLCVDCNCCKDCCQCDDEDDLDEDDVCGECGSDLDESGGCPECGGEEPPKAGGN